MKTISIINQKGGVGKTSTCIEIGAALAYDEKKVLLIDLDAQCNLTSYVGALNDTTVEKALTIADVLTEKAKASEVIQTREFGKNITLDVIGCSPVLSNADKMFPESNDVFRLVDALEEIAKNYDFILIDTNPARNQLLKMAYAASDYAIIPTDSASGSLDGIISIYEDIKKNRTGRIPICNLKIISLLLTRFERSKSYDHAMEELNEMAQSMEDEPIVQFTHKSIKMSECKEYSVPLFYMERFNPVALDYKGIADSIIEIAEKEE